MRPSDLPESSAAPDQRAADQRAAGRAAVEQPAADRPAVGRADQLAADRFAADSRPARDWQALADRLSRLPDAHPSSPAGNDRVWWRGPGEQAAGEHGEIRRDHASRGGAQSGADGEPRADEEPGWEAERESASAEPGWGGEADPGPDADPEELSVAEDALTSGDQDPPGRRTAGRAGPGGATADGGAGRAAFRPWFAGGGPSEPWFAVGPDGPAYGPERPTGPDG